MQSLSGLINQLRQPPRHADCIEVIAGILRYVRNTLLSLEQTAMRQDSRDAPGKRRESAEVIERLSGEVVHYMDQSLAVRSIDDVKDFDPVRMMLQMFAIFEFKASQKDITFELDIGHGSGSSVQGNEAACRSFFVLLLSFMLEKVGKGGSLKCSLLSEKGSGIQFRMEWVDGEETLSSVHGKYIEDLLLYLVRVLFSELKGTLFVDSEGKACEISLFVQGEAAAAESPGETPVDTESGINDNGSEIEVPADEERPRDIPVERIPEVTALKTTDPNCAADGESALRVVIAEDNMLTQRFLTRIMEEDGHSVICVNNGRELITRLEREAFDFALIDCQMGVLDGYKATGVIRANEARLGRRTVIVGMATHLDVDTEERCLQAGMDGYLSKPVHKGRLLEVLARCCRRHGRTKIAD